jgi:hypothetical protein
MWKNTIQKLFTRCSTFPSPPLFSNETRKKKETTKKDSYLTVPKLKFAKRRSSAPFSFFSTLAQKTFSPLFPPLTMHLCAIKTDGEVEEEAITRIKQLKIQKIKITIRFE